MVGPRTMTESSLRRRLSTPKDAAAVAVFRMVFGTIVAVSAIRTLAHGWLETMFGNPFRFAFWGFAWLPAPSLETMRGLFVLLSALGLLIAVGLFYRVAIVATFVLFTYAELLDVSNYLNHYYLLSLLAALLAFIPAHRLWSIDVLRRPTLRLDTLPAWCTYLLRFQIAVVYVNAGLAKLTTDWLLEAQPLQIWLASRTSIPLVGPWLSERWVAYAAAWGGFLFDTTIAGFLLWRRSRPLAYVAVLGFHTATGILFPIGMFPFIMTGAAMVFFDPSWPRRLLARLGLGHPRADGETAAFVFGRPALAVLALYAFVQVAIPLRAHLYGGNVLWHEQGMRFSWRVMAREKNGSVTFLVRQPATGRTWHVSPSEYLTPLQEREMTVQPDLILQMAHHIARDFEAKGHGRVEVRADARASWNGRLSSELIDPTVDLAREHDGLASKPWIRPAPTSPPLKMRPVVAHSP